MHRSLWPAPRGCLTKIMSALVVSTMVNPSRAEWEATPGVFSPRNAWSLRPDLQPFSKELRKASNSLRRRWGDQTTWSTTPCSENHWGDHAHVGEKHAHTFEGSFHTAMANTLGGQGYVVLRQLLDPEALRKDAKIFARQSQRPEMKRLPFMSQPNRSKFAISASSAPELHRTLRSWNRLYFMAWHLLGLAKGDNTTYSSTTNYLSLIERTHKMSVNNAASHPNCVFQNPHWDSLDRTMLSLDVPLVDVDERNAPFQIWPETHEMPYHSVLMQPEPVMVASNTQRQYYACPHQLLALARSWPSVIQTSLLGDVMVRWMRTWHRGTPNPTSKTRDMLTIYFRPRGSQGKNTGYKAVPKELRKWMCEEGNVCIGAANRTSND